MNMLDHMVSTYEAAIMSGYSQAHIKDSCAAGKIVSKKIGSTWIIDKRLFDMKKDNIINKQLEG